MDLIQFVDKHQRGLVTNHQYSRKMEYLFLKRLYSYRLSEFTQFEFSEHSSDFALYETKLLVVNNNFTVGLYDISKHKLLRRSCIKVWNGPFTFGSGTESINWNADGTFFTVTTDTDTLYSLDAEEMVVFDKIKIKNSVKILQHKPNPHNRPMLAVASLLPNIVLVDLRSGNITRTSSCHPNGVLSVSWCGISENLLATSGSDSTCFWDIRRLKMPVFKNTDNCCDHGILPNFDIIPNTDKIIILNSDRTTTVWDVHKCKKVSHFGNFHMPTSERFRYKFALGGLCETYILFMPSSNYIKIYDFTNMTLIGTLQGHILPVKTLFFNNNQNLLYSSSLDGTHVWVPGLYS